VFEFLNRFFGTLGEGLNAAVIKVFHIPSNLMPRRRTLSKKPVTNALNSAANHKFSGNDHPKKV
jgi:hypothetical protein